MYLANSDKNESQQKEKNSNFCTHKRERKHEKFRTTGYVKKFTNVTR